MATIFATFQNLFSMLFAFCPPAVAVLFIVLFGLLAVIIVCKIVAFILDMIPFM